MRGTSSEPGVGMGTVVTAKRVDEGLLLGLLWGGLRGPKSPTEYLGGENFNFAWHYASDWAGLTVTPGSLQTEFESFTLIDEGTNRALETR